MTAAIEPACPKRMVFGPCGGVRDDSGCEMGPQPCPFTRRPLVTWPGDPAAAAAAAAAASGPTAVPAQGSLLALAATRPVVLTDLTVRPFDRGSVAAVTGLLAPASDALLVGEHQNRPDYPPTFLAAHILAAGGRPWMTLTCRDRNRLVLEQELEGLSALGVEGVLCATGDGRAHGVRPGVTQVFDLDGPRLAHLAAGIGLAPAVPESPEAAPRGLRAHRVVEKQSAGARLCVLNHASSPAALAAFVGAARAAGATLPFLAGVAVYTDARSAAVLQGFPGLHLDARAVAAVLDAADPVTAGIDAAVAEARALLAIPGVVGVNLSGLGCADGEEAAAGIKAAVGREVLGR